MGEFHNDSDDLTLGEVLERHRDATQEELHTQLPGRIESFDAANQVADVTPMLTRRIPRRDGSFLSERMPTLRAVPVVFPGAGGWFMRFPLVAGDTVMLVMLERDAARWRVTGELSDPIDIRHHHLAHAVAIPGLRSRPGKLPAPTGTALEFGHVGGSTIRINDDGSIQAGGPGATSFVSLADKIDAVVNAITGAVIAPGDGGAAIKAAVVLAWTGVGNSSAATKVKAL